MRDQLVAGDVAAAQAWAVTAAQAIAAAPDKLAFAFPSEGFARYADTMAILRESRRQDLAHRFIELPAAAGSGRGRSSMATQTATANAAAPRSASARAARKSGALSARLKLWRAANGSRRNRLRRSGCGIVCGPRSRVRRRRVGECVIEVVQVFSVDDVYAHLAGETG